MTFLMSRYQKVKNLMERSHGAAPSIAIGVLMEDVGLDGYHVLDLLLLVGL